MQNITFSFLLNQLLVANETTLKSVYHTLLDQSVNDISYKSLSSYKNFTRVPTLLKAKQILNVFNYQIDEVSLINILNYSKDNLKNFREYLNESLDFKIYLSPKNFNNDKYNLEQKLHIRITELQFENINQYINYLVKKDLENSGLLKGEFNK